MSTKTLTRLSVLFVVLGVLSWLAPSQDGERPEFPAVAVAGDDAYDAGDYRGASRPVPAAPFPRWAAVMAERLGPHFAGALPVQCIVNEYRPGQGIGMHAGHRDFGGIVASLSLRADWPMRFRPRASRPYAAGALPGDEVAVLPRRSVLVLAGAARHRWMHGIDRRTSARETATRVSATFRTLAA